MGLVRMAARTAVVAGTATAVSGRGAPAERAVGRGRPGSLRPADGAAAGPAGSPADDKTAELQNLAQLHSQGVLTDEEFAAAKAKSLGI